VLWQNRTVLVWCQRSDSIFTFVKPILDQAASRDIAEAITHIVRETKESRQLAIAIEQVSQHVYCRQPLIVVVLQPLMSC
jgi:hypothetical protein